MGECGWEREYLAARGKETKIRFWLSLSLLLTQRRGEIKVGPNGLEKIF